MSHPQDKDALYHCSCGDWHYKGELSPEHREPSSLTTHVLDDAGRGYLVTAIDRPPQKGERGWYAERAAELDEVLCDAVYYGSPRHEGWPACGDEGVDDACRLVTVVVDDEPDDEPAPDAAPGDARVALADGGTLNAHERDLADQGAIIPAIRAVRDRHPGMSLMDAKQMVDAYRDVTRGRALALADRGDLDVETHAIAEVDAAPLGATHGTMDLELTVMPLRVRVKFEEGGRSPYDAGVFVSVCLAGTCLRGETEDGEDHEIAWYSTLRGGWVIDKKVDISSRTYATFAIEPCAASGAHEGARDALAEGGSR